jgi:hypothetical protein
MNSTQARVISLIIPKRRRLDVRRQSGPAASRFVFFFFTNTKTYKTVASEKMESKYFIIIMADAESFERMMKFVSLNGIDAAYEYSRVRHRSRCGFNHSKTQRKEEKKSMAIRIKTKQNYNCIIKCRN